MLAVFTKLAEMHLSCTLANSNIVEVFTEFSAKLFSCKVANFWALTATSSTLVMFPEMFPPIIILVSPTLTRFSDQLLSWSLLSNLSAKKVSQRDQGHGLMYRGPDDQVGTPIEKATVFKATGEFSTSL